MCVNMKIFHFFHIPFHVANLISATHHVSANCSDSVYALLFPESFIRVPGGKNNVAFNDEQVTVFDCLERLHDYDFVTVLDVDEFLVPTNSLPNGSWKTMLVR